MRYVQGRAALALCRLRSGGTVLTLRRYESCGGLSRKVRILGCEHIVKVRGDRDCWVASAPQQELGLHLDTIARAPADQQQRSIMLLFDGERY